MEYRLKGTIEAFQFHEDMGTYTYEIPRWFLDACNDGSILEYDGRTCFSRNHEYPPSFERLIDGGFVILCDGYMKCMAAEDFHLVYEPVRSE